MSSTPSSVYIPFKKSCPHFYLENKEQIDAIIPKYLQFKIPLDEPIQLIIRPTQSYFEINYDWVHLYEKLLLSFDPPQSNLLSDFRLNRLVRIWSIVPIYFSGEAKKRIDKIFESPDMNPQNTLVDINEIMAEYASKLQNSRALYAHNDIIRHILGFESLLEKRFSIPED